MPIFDFLSRRFGSLIKINQILKGISASNRENEISTSGLPKL